jgi:Domain of unknown function (DUF4440)
MATDKAIELAQKFSEAMVAGDARALDGMLADEFTYVHSSARIEPKSELVPRIGERGNARMEFEGMTVRSYPQADIVSGLAHMVVGPANQPLVFDSLFSAVWVKEDGRPRLAVYHSTRLPEA